MARAVALLLLASLALGAGGDPATVADPPGPGLAPAIAVARSSIGSVRAQSGGSPTSPETGTPTSPAADPGRPNPLGSGAGIVILAVMAAAFVWLRRRALRR